MSWIDIEQNTDEWLELRAGKVGGSSIGKIMANYGKAFGDPAKRLAVQIALEQITGKPQGESYTNDHMARGHEQEPVARALYEDWFFCDVTNGGFFDNGLTGVSPDGLIQADGLIEIKSVIAPVHFATVKRGSFDPAYKWQLLFNLKESGRDWIDYVSYCADFPEGKRLFVYRVPVDNNGEFFDMIDTRLAEFFELVEENKKIIEAC
jgi:hypothetical protein